MYVTPRLQTGHFSLHVSKLDEDYGIDEGEGEGEGETR